MTTVIPAPLPPVRNRQGTTLRLSLLFARPGRTGLGELVLPLIAYAVTTALITVIIGGTEMFWRLAGDYALAYRLVSAFALALLIVPMTSLGAAAARLSARRRDDRLASLRLLGATGAEIGRLTVLSAATTAVVGALLGVALSLPLTVLLGSLSFVGAPIGAAALWPGTMAVVWIVAGIGVIGVLSAVTGLRRVIVSPLGVRTRVRTPQPGWLRPATAVALMAVALLLTNLAMALASELAFVLAFAAAFAVGLIVLGVVGPWLISLWARSLARRAKTAVALLSARAVQADPGAAWRQVSGVALSVFIAIIGGVGLVIVNAPFDDSVAGDADRMFVADLGLGIGVVLVATFIVTAATVAITQVARVYDRRGLWVAMDRTGVPRRTLNAMRVREALGPLVFVTVAAVIAAVVIVLPLAGLAILLDPLVILVLLGTIALGVLLVVAATVLARPALRTVMAHPERA